ncbi:zinc finger protein 133-like [Synchiropus splendidus]|uniref:zinc finger protein 133-like n=1 Tax=Synchiropus splendidus TaxID=270530 RepID=UPI00237E8257|nr:zinc finger protein 133-like [Synchiropus splendidus]
MTSLQSLRQLINERLTATVQEIFGLFQQTVVELETELERRQKLLDALLQPSVPVPRIDLPHQLLRTQVTQESACSRVNTDPSVPGFRDEREELDATQCAKEPGPDLVQEPEEEKVKGEPGEHCIGQLQEEEEDGLFIPNVSVSSSSSVLLNQKTGKDEVSASRRQGWSASGVPSRPEEASSPSETSPEADDAASTSSLLPDPLCVCDFCGLKFQTWTLLQGHVKAHISGSLVSCSLCGADFGLKTQLRQHMKAHSTHDLHTCPQNWKVQSHSGEKAYVCCVCGKMYSSRAGVVYHCRTHTGERPFTCHICGKAFRCKSYMTAHMRLHTGERPFACSRCCKRFKRRAHLKRHCLVHNSTPSSP